MAFRLVLARGALELPFRQLAKINPDGVEIEWLTWTSLSPLKRRTLTRQLRSTNMERIVTVPEAWISLRLEPEIRHDRLEQLQEWTSELGSKRIHAIEGRKSMDRRSPSSLNPHVTHWELAAHGSQTAEHEDAPTIHDPFHHFGILKNTNLPARVSMRAPRGAYWKIHGWHPDRWIRRYGQEALARLALWMRKTQATHVCFAHSQRVEQLQEFRALLQRL